LSQINNFTEEQCSIVRSQDHPPGSTVVYLGAIDGPIAPMGYWGAKVHLELGHTPFRDFHFHTVHVGPLVMDMFEDGAAAVELRHLESVDVPTEVDLPYESATKIFLPTGNCPWPPRRVLRWDELVALTRRGLGMPEESTPPGPHWTDEPGAQ